MLCPNCKTIIPEGASFCPECGLPAANQEPAVSAAPNAAAPAPQPYAPPSEPPEYYDANYAPTVLLSPSDLYPDAPAAPAAPPAVSPAAPPAAAEMYSSPEAPVYSEQIAVPAPKKKSKLPLIITLIVIVLLIGGAAAYYFIFGIPFLGRSTEKLVEEYITHTVNEPDAEALVELLPAGMSDYIGESEDTDFEQLTSELSDSLTEFKSSLDECDSWSVSYKIKSEKDAKKKELEETAEELKSEAGINIAEMKNITVEVTLATEAGGNKDKQKVDIEICAVRVKSDWYILDSTTDDLTENHSIFDSELLSIKASEAVNSYMKALTEGDLEKVMAYYPEEMLSSLETTEDVSRYEITKVIEDFINYLRSQNADYTVAETRDPTETQREQFLKGCKKTFKLNASDLKYVDVHIKLDDYDDIYTIPALKANGKWYILWLAGEALLEEYADIDPEFYD